LIVNPTEIIEEATPLPNHLQETTPGAMIFGVSFEMCGQALNLLGKEGNLNLRRSSIGLVHMKLLNYFVFPFRCLHAGPFFFCIVWNSPLTRRFPSVKVTTPATGATAPVATPPQPLVHRLRTGVVPSRVTTRRKAGHAKHLVARSEAVPPSEERLARLGSHAAHVPEKEWEEYLLPANQRGEEKVSPR
jgi:hypothetical protein